MCLTVLVGSVGKDMQIGIYCRSISPPHTRQMMIPAPVIATVPAHVINN